MTDDHSNGPYCICRSYDDSRFMICCDRCNQWFHGDCIRVKADEAKKITHFYCPPCQKANPALMNVYRNVASSSLSSHHDKDDSAFAPLKVNERRGSTTTATISKPSSAPSPNCNNCIGCFRTEDCGRCDTCKNPRRAGMCRLRQCVNLLTENIEVATHRKPQEPSSESSKRVDTATKLKNVGPPKKTGKVGRPAKVQKSLKKSVVIAGSSTRAGARAFKSFMKDAGLLEASDEEGPDSSRQCYGPQCQIAARPNSKYCSEECGIELASQRIREILPSRLQSWSCNKPIAEEYETRRLNRINLDQEAARQKLSDLDNEEKQLNAWLTSCESIRKEDNDDDVDMGDSEDPEANIYCVTCGTETSTKQALRHFSKCFSKYESQTSYGSSFKAFNNLYNVFCDTYNKANGTYCKRLRVICPEHAKDPKVDADEICGASLNDDYAAFSISNACTSAKKSCVKHYKWEKIRRALIDMERLSLLLRLDELFDEKRCIQAAQSTRGNLLALLLHRTVSDVDNERFASCDTIKTTSGEENTLVSSEPMDS